MDRGKSRTASNLTTATQTQEGTGFLVNHPFPTSGLADYNPFLLPDEMGPADLAPNEPKGAPGEQVMLPVPPDYNPFAYVFGGSGSVGGNQRSITAHQMVLFATDGESMSISSSSEE